jgi:hypothetical protein
VIEDCAIRLAIAGIAPLPQCANHDCANAPMSQCGNPQWNGAILNQRISNKSSIVNPQSPMDAAAAP